MHNFRDFQREGVFIEWKSEEELQSMAAPPPEGSSEHTDGWAVLHVDSVGYKNDKSQSGEYIPQVLLDSRKPIM